ncbi:unnamed protein product [Thelazia callipaeda]|uniref:Tyrosine-protein phosphatase domain-containing protein n=1 Tax=Thelazia callipaeda TaxID=103827 RepID=A0A0N5CMJ8_THECL|nr:unnamed protein product [Thelazia callipaeda]
MNVIERVTYEHNVYIDECPESITRSACRRVIMIEGEKPLYEGSNGGSIIMYVNSWPMLVGVLSARQNVGKANQADNWYHFNDFRQHSLPTKDSYAAAI